MTFELRTLAAETPVVLEQGDDQVLIDNARIMLENGRLAFSDMRRLFDANGNLKPTHEWDADMAAVVQSIETRELFGEGADGKRQIGVVHKVKLWPKGDALERLMRHLEMFEKDASQPNPNSALSDEELVRKFQMLAKRLGMTIAVPALPSRG